VLPRKPYPTDVSAEEWAFVAPYLPLMTRDAPQRRHDLREVFNALRWIIRAGALWRLLPTNFSPWEAAYQQPQRWLKAGCFAAMVHDLRLLRWSAGRAYQPTAVIIDGDTRQWTPGRGHRAGEDRHKRRTCSKPHAAVHTLGKLLVLHVTPAAASARARMAALAEEVQTASG
jgi:transposase